MTFEQATTEYIKNIDVDGYAFKVGEDQEAILIAGEPDIDEAFRQAVEGTRPLKETSRTVAAT